MQLTILDIVIKATLVLAIAAAAAAMLRQASASMRHLVWTLGLLGALSAPLLSFAVPRWELPMDKELEFVDEVLDFYTPEDRERLLGKNALDVWKFPA